MEDKPLTESINKQYSKYGSLRIKEKESKIELCNAEDPLKFLTRIDSSIKDAKARVKQSIDNSTISEDYDSSLDQSNQPLPPHLGDYSNLDTIPMVKFGKRKSLSTSPYNQHHEAPRTSTTTSTAIQTISYSTTTSSRGLEQEQESKVHVQCSSNNDSSTKLSSSPGSSRQ